MKKLLAVWSVIVLFLSAGECYFSFDLYQTSGKNGYTQQDINLIIGNDNIWIKPYFYSYDTDSTERLSNFGAKAGFERNTYTASFGIGYTPEKSGYKNVSVSGDITFSLNPTSSSRKRLAGPNSGFTLRNTSGITQIDIGAGLGLISHSYTNTDRDIKELNTLLFAGAKVFFTEFSVNYSFSSYDKESLAKIKAPAVQKIEGITSVFPVFIKRSFNARVKIPSSPFVTPYFSYTALKTKSEDDINVYGFGAYIDLSMVGVNAHFETYKDTLNKTQRYLSLGAGIKF